MKKIKKYFNNLHKKIQSKKSIVGVVGVGYVGIQLLIQLSKQNFKTIGFDKDKNKLSKLSTGESPFSYISNQKIKSLKKKCFYTDKYENIRICDIIIICLPTPIKKDTKPDLSAIVSEFDTYGLLEAVEQVNDQVREDRDWEHMVGRAVLEEEE